MCHRHSFILDRTGKVHDGYGITNSHTTIRQLSGLGVNDSSSYAFEWQPPPGWPSSNFYDGMTQDTAPIPAWELNASHVNAMERHIRGLYPDIGAWESGDKVRPLPAGLVVEWDLYLSGCTSLTALPAGLVVKGDLYLSGCTSLTALPAGLVVKGDLYLRGCTALTALPAGLVVEGALYLRGCTALTALPPGLVVKGKIIGWG